MDSRDYHLFCYIPQDQQFCFARPRPRGAYIPAFKLTCGESIEDRYPADPYAVTLQLDDNWPSLKLGSYVGNAGSLLILDKTVAGFLQDFPGITQLETHAFTLLNHKGREHSRRYLFVNPLGTRDCLDYAQSEIRRGGDGSIREVSRIVLDKGKLQGAPALFRIQDSPRSILFSADLVAALKAQKFTNMSFAKVQSN